MASFSMTRIIANSRDLGLPCQSSETTKSRKCEPGQSQAENGQCLMAKSTEIMAIWAFPIRTLTATEARKFRFGQQEAENKQFLIARLIEDQGNLGLPRQSFETAKL